MHKANTLFTEGNKMFKKTALLVVTAFAFSLFFGGVAFAEDPVTYNEATGASAWTYEDPADLGDAKYEGSYNEFEDGTMYTTNPHGGYTTTSNNCKTCHAVHRANGSFALLRVDNADEACNYCHIGANRHSDLEAYFNGSEGIYSTNGHTIGSGKEIPDSSVWQWTEEVTIEVADGDDVKFDVRRYRGERNKVMKYVVHGGRFIRTGPTYLRCASCHQVHNAYQQIWKPVSSGIVPGSPAAGQPMPGGYKLLRNSPSGGISVKAADESKVATAVAGAVDRNTRLYSKLNFTYFDPAQTAMDPDTPGANIIYEGADTAGAGTAADYRIKALETNAGLNPITGKEVGTGNVIQGPNKTGYTAYKYYAPSNADAGNVTNMRIQETSLAFWCADCHNLNIAGKAQVEGYGAGRTGDGMLGDRSHQVPNMLRNNTVAAAGGQCYMCHNNDMPLDGTSAVVESGASDCGACHITPRMYHYYKNGVTGQGSGTTWAAGGQSYATLGARSEQQSDGKWLITDHGTTTAQNRRSDFPHSGPDWGSKLLNARDRRTQTGGGNNRTDTNPWLSNHPGGATGYDIQGSAYSPASGDGTDKVCKTCHGGTKSREIGHDK